MFCENDMHMGYSPISFSWILTIACGLVTLSFLVRINLFCFMLINFYWKWTKVYLYLKRSEEYSGNWITMDFKGKGKSLKIIPLIIRFMKASKVFMKLVSPFFLHQSVLLHAEKTETVSVWTSISSSTNMIDILTMFSNINTSWHLASTNAM